MVNPGSLTYGGTDFVNGMYGKLKEGSDNEYEFVDDGRKADFVTRGMILWSKAGEYKLMPNLVLHLSLLLNMNKKRNDYEKNIFYITLCAMLVGCWL